MLTTAFLALSSLHASQVEVGDVVTLKVVKVFDDHPPFNVAATKLEIFDIANDYLDHDKVDAFWDLVMEGLLLPIPKDTQARVIQFSQTPENKQLCAQVSILNGSRKGSSVWTGADSLIKD